MCPPALVCNILLLYNPVLLYVCVVTMVYQWVLRTYAFGTRTELERLYVLLQILRNLGSYHMATCTVSFVVSAVPLYLPLHAILWFHTTLVYIYMYYIACLGFCLFIIIMPSYICVFYMFFFLSSFTRSVCVLLCLLLYNLDSSCYCHPYTDILDLFCAFHSGFTTCNITAARH
jgi:hypothetical protein